MSEISPMLLSEIFYKEGIFDNYKDWIAQIKFNGVFGIIHIKDSKIVGIRNRENNPIFYLYPELEELRFRFKQAVMVAEICIFKNGKSIFYGGIDHRRTRKTDRENPVTLVVHDVLRLDANTTINMPYKERYKLIKDNITTGPLIVVPDNYHPEELWKGVIAKDYEGIVLKNQLALYEIGARSKSYIKVKNYKQVEIIVDDVEENPKGTKIIGRTDINGEHIEVEVQLGGVFNAAKGQKIPIKYLDVVGKRLVQPTKI